MVESVPEPPWLLAMVDQRLALLAQHKADRLVSADTVVMTTLTEPPPGVSNEGFLRWEATCDNCGKYCPTTLWTGHVIRTVNGGQMIFVFGVCPECKERYPDG